VRSLLALWLLVGLVAAVGCGKSHAPQPAAPAAAPDATVAAHVTPAADAGPARARPLGPGVAECEQAADHLAALVEDSALGPTAEQRAYLEHVLSHDRAQVIDYCVQLAVPKEVECIRAAKEVPGLFGCERFRREVPSDLAERRELTRADCERFYDRLRGFKLEEGASPAEVDNDRDQIIRACQDKAKVGTVACFIASPSYEQARRCP
jgi:hypothetical protein